MKTWLIVGGIGAFLFWLFFHKKKLAVPAPSGRQGASLGTMVGTVIVVIGGIVWFASHDGISFDNAGRTPEERACLNFHDYDSSLAMLCAGGREGNTNLIQNVMRPFLDHGKWSIKTRYIEAQGCYIDARISGIAANGYPYEWKDACPFSVKSYRDCKQTDTTGYTMLCWYKSIPTNEERADITSWRRANP